MAIEVESGTMLARRFDWDDVRFRPRRIGEAVTLNYGKSLVAAKRRPGVIPMFGTNGQCGTHDTSLSNGPGVILGRKGEGHLGVKWVTQPFWVIDTAYYATFDRREVDARWFYFVTSFVGLDHLKTGEKPGLSRDTFGRQVFPFPEFNDQQAIGKVLGALDDKIELNRAMNRTLEDLAQALFRSWFIEFDPVVAKAAGRAPFGFAPRIAALFPCSFSDSKLGPIPLGWHADKVNALATMSRGGINPGAFASEVFDHYSLPAFDDGYLPKSELGSTIKSNKFPVPPDCVLISKLNPQTPRVWMPELSNERRSICSTEFLVMTPKPPFSREFLRCLFSCDSFTSEFATLVTGTSGSHQRVKPESLVGMDTIIPSDPEVQCFTDITRPWFTQIAHNIRESCTLATLRDTLLPKLLSGELHIKDAEQKVATAI